MNQEHTNTYTAVTRVLSTATDVIILWIVWSVRRDLCIIGFIRFVSPPVPGIRCCMLISVFVSVGLGGMRTVYVRCVLLVLFHIDRNVLYVHRIVKYAIAIINAPNANNNTH